MKAATVHNQSLGELVKGIKWKDLKDRWVMLHPSQSQSLHIIHSVFLSLFASVMNEEVVTFHRLLINIEVVIVCKYLLSWAESQWICQLNSGVQRHQSKARLSWKVKMSLTQSQHMCQMSIKTERNTSYDKTQPCLLVMSFKYYKYETANTF